MAMHPRNDKYVVPGSSVLKKLPNSSQQKQTNTYLPDDKKLTDINPITIATKKIVDTLVGLPIQKIIADNLKKSIENS